LLTKKIVSAPKCWDNCLMKLRLKPTRLLSFRAPARNLAQQEKDFSLALLRNDMGALQLK
jgi:hypothetical protein